MYPIQNVPTNLYYQSILVIMQQLDPMVPFNMSFLASISLCNFVFFIIQLLTLRIIMF